MKKRKTSRNKDRGAILFKRTFKSYSPRERWISVLCLFIFLLSGWKGVTGNWKGRTLTAAVTGGHNYNEGLVGEILRLNPVYADLNSVDRDITSLIFEGLAKYDPKQQKVIDHIGTHLLDETQTVYTFQINEGITWHDGEPVTVEDVYFTYHDVIQHPEFENPILKSNFEGVEIELTDEETVTFTLNEPNSFFFTQLTIGLLPQHILQDVEVGELDTHEFNQYPIGNGPYQASKAYDRNMDDSTEIGLTYYNDYWKDEKPDITAINFFAFPTYEELKKARGQLHGMAHIQKFRLENLTDERFNENQYFLPQYTALFLETNNQEIVKKETRLGLQKAIDKQAIIEKIGYDRVIDTPLLELDQEDWITETNLEEAAGSLFDAGWSLDEETNTRVSEDGEEVLALRLVRRSYPNNERQEETTQTTAEMIQEQLQAVGVTVNLQSYEDDQFQRVIQERDYDLLLYGQNLGYNLDTYSFWHSSQADNGLNLSNYGNAKADFYIEAIRTSFNDEKDQKTAYLQSLATLIKEDIPAVFLYTPTYYFLTDERIEGIFTNYLLLPHDRFANILDWTINK